MNHEDNEKNLQQNNVARCVRRRPIKKCYNGENNFQRVYRCTGIIVVDTGMRYRCVC